MAMITLVREGFKPARKPRESRAMKELKEELESERQRADDLSDELSKLRDNEHEDETLITHERLKELEACESLLEDIKYLQSELKIARERASLGIEYAVNESQELQEQLMELEA